MFERIFGGSDEEQLEFLQVRSIATIIAIVLAIFGFLFTNELLVAPLGFIFMFVWGMEFVKATFGFTAFGIIFSGTVNIGLGAILFVFYMIVAAFTGMFVAVVGVGRWIHLKIKYAM